MEYLLVRTVLKAYNKNKDDVEFEMLLKPLFDMATFITSDSNILLNNLIEHYNQTKELYKSRLNIDPSLELWDEPVLKQELERLGNQINDFLKERGFPNLQVKL